MQKEELWQAVLAQIQLNISRANFVTWFKNTEIIEKDKEKVVIGVPNSFVEEWLKQKYHKTIFKIIHTLDKNVKEVAYTIKKQGLKIQPKEYIPPNQLELIDSNTDKQTNLNTRYTFENYVVGSFNELAHAAALAVCKNPGLIYNPLFVYSGVGLGKTHLLQASGNKIVKDFKEKKVNYIPAANFVSEVIWSIKNKKIEELKRKYQKNDVLIIDDIQFLAGKEKTQEEFFHIFNHLYEKNKQIIISSDRPPKTIPSLAERLKSRFEGGMVVDIGLPDYETRFTILKSKIEEKNIEVSNKILDYIATNIKTNIRELEGALNQVLIYYYSYNKFPDIEILKTKLKDIIQPQLKSVSLPKIISAVAKFYGLKEKDLLNPSRKKEIVFPRQIAMYLLRKELNYSFSSIGRRFKGKDHTTAIYAFEKINLEISKNDKIKEEIESIRQMIYTG